MINLRGLKILIVLLAVIIGLSISGWIYQYQASQTDSKLFPAPGKLVMVDGYNMHIDCRGQGSPVLLLEAGGMNDSVSWHTVHDKLAEITTVCAYDRQGMGWSEPTKNSTRAPDVAVTLNKLLHTADIPTPVVMVGLSAGGLYSREYYRQFPDDVAAMVLVDSSHEQQTSRMAHIELPFEKWMQIIPGVCRWLQPVGLIRLSGVMDAFAGTFPIGDRRTELAANLNRSYSCRSLEREVSGFFKDTIADSPPETLQDLPLTVISQGKALRAEEMFAGVSEADLTEFVAVWAELQLELAGLSSQGQRVIATQSGHVIPFEQPAILIEELTKVVEAARHSRGTIVKG